MGKECSCQDKDNCPCYDDGEFLDRTDQLPCREEPVDLDEEAQEVEFHSPYNDG